MQAPRGRPRLSCAHKGVRSVPKSPASGLSCSFARDLPRNPAGPSRLGPLQTSRFRPRAGSRGRLSVAALGAGEGAGSPSEPPSVAPRPLTHPTWERAAGSCWRCASTGRCAAATGPGAAPDPWQPPSLVIDRPLGRREPSLGDPGLRLYSSPSQDACAARSALGRGAGQMWPAIPGAREARRRPPAAEESCAGGWGSVPQASVCARGGCRRSVRASDSLINFTRAPGGKQETPRQQLGRTSRRPRAFQLRSSPPASSPRLPPAANQGRWIGP